MSEQYKLSREVEAAMTLKASMGELAEDDQLLADMINGETDIHEAITAVVTSMDEDQILLDGIVAREVELDARKHRIKNRIAAKRTAVEQAMSIAEIKKIEAATFTLSLKRKPEGLVIEDEAEIPAAFWKAQDPKLDKAAIKGALKDGNAVPGASLDNGGIALQIRRK